MILKLNIFLILAIITDFLVILHLSGASLPTSTLIEFFIIHFFVALLSLFPTIKILKLVYRVIPKLFVVLLFGFSFFMPVVGIIANCIMANMLYLFFNKNPKHQIRHVIFDHSIQPLKSMYGIGGLSLQLKSPDFPLAVRTRAFFALSNIKDSRTNVLVREILTDDQEELRLLAFGLLEQKEQALSQQINLILQHLKHTSDAVQKAQLEKCLAKWYWELVYQHLVEKDLMIITLEKSIKYAEAALKVLSNDETLWVLLGRIYQKLNDRELSQKAYSKAEELGAPAEHILPYLAEEYFQQHNFKKIAPLLLSKPILAFIPTVGPIVQFWGKKYD